ncbi:MAG: M48 family metallopeptidase [Sphingobacteriia bacterium]|nr:M48 family metallopeptidase [Sphingobacteriia bacterium]
MLVKTEEDKFDWVNGERVINFKLLPSRRKTYSISICSKSSITIKVPKRFNQTEVVSLINKYEAWIFKKLKENSFKIKTPILPINFQNGEVFLLLGKECNLKLNSSVRNSVRFENSNLYIDYVGFYNKEKIIKLFSNWYENFLTTVFNELIVKALQTFVLPPKIQISLKTRLMKARWGSMSKKGEMTLNRRLIHTHFECIEYVIMHELCHTYHFNHSPKFYALLKFYIPDWKAKKEKLKLYT